MPFNIAKRNGKYICLYIYVQVNHTNVIKKSRLEYTYKKFCDRKLTLLSDSW